MKTRFLSAVGAWICALAIVCVVAADAVRAADIRRAIPSSVHMMVYCKHNAERDYQRKYVEEAWQTAADERLGQKIIDIVTSRVPEKKLEKARSALDQVKEALEPISSEALLNAKELVFAQRMEGPFNHNLCVIRLDDEEAENLEKGVTQLFGLAEKWSDGKVKVESEEMNAGKITRLQLPEKKIPYQPAVARSGDLVILCSSPKLMRESLEQLQSSSGESKFDDPRLKEALKHLPKAEDTLTFFDGKQLWKSLGGIGDFIRKEKPDDEKADRVAKVIDRVIEEISILDYEVAVAYTEEGQNRTAAMGKLAEDYEDKFLAQALTQGEPFENWHKWVPADATSYSLNTGVNLHTIYEGVMEFVQDEFPEAKHGLEHFEEHQEELGVNLDKDILQSFSGECVSVTVPIEVNGKTSQQGVTALKCENPERVQELLGRAIEALQELPAVQAQGLELEDSEDLEGFQELHANLFMMAGVKPVIGFSDGWMIISSHEKAAKKLLDVRAGKAKSIDRGKSLAKFDLDIEGDVYAVNYSDVGAGIRQAADAIDWAGSMAPMFVGMIAAKAKPEDIEPLQEAIGLLPSIAKVVRKFDFFDKRLTVVHEGPDERSYLKDSVTLIREPGDKDSASESESEAEEEEEAATN